MITKDNLKALLKTLGFNQNQEIYSKKFEPFDCELSVDFKNQKLLYPKSLTIHDKTTSNFSSNENFVVFECVHRLLSQGYNPKHIELEPKWQLGGTSKSGKADIQIKDNEGKSLIIIECKTAGSEFKKAWDRTLNGADQIFSYAKQDGDTKFIALYASDFLDKKLVSDYYLINLVDDKKYLYENNLKKSYKEAKTVEDIYEVWSETYKKAFKTRGIFESNKAYFVGLEKTNIDDLNIVSSKDIQGKYNSFATIMRQHNIGSPERAFNVLVNLFLCKIIDENSNQKNKESELKFYWKGVSYDDAFGLQDRLQELYKEGMFNFLNEEITYISDKTIDDMFEKVDINSLKEDVKKRFREQKFFTNNDFSFLDVHSEMLFYKNFEVLLKVIELFQDIRLTGVEDNQFLGDMFEGFLDNGVKQSEGQFFTPMPIVKFIINALPLDAIKKQEDKPKAIDYACGAGHFLNEVAKIFDTDEVVGIEKEYRLSKVAKVSALMYGQENINIIYNDALKEDKNIQNSSFSLLVANPPYSVKGFLETLPKEEREKFELIKSIEAKSYTANNSIECFFIERAKQLLKTNGVAGIILPSSILSKGEGANTYVATREIILKYFDIVAIAEFGSGTFGKTGTNTVTLFLKRINDVENIVGRYADLTKNIFKGNINIQGQFTDKEILKRYTQHIGINYDLYKSFLAEQPSKKLLKIEIVEAYLSAFEKATETKHRRKATYYKRFSKIRKYKTEKKAFITYVKSIEADKFYYFTLSCENSQKVLIIKAPTDNKANKKFLGYEWSGRKGNEGIQYNGGTLNSINTLLYNPIDKDDESKINTLITKNFANEEVEIPKDLEEFVSKAKLVDMLDFTRVEFSKALGLSFSKKVEIESKWELIKIENIAIKIFAGGDKPQNISEIKTDTNNIPIYANGVKEKGLYGFTDIFKVEEKCVTVSARGTIGYSVLRDEKFYPIVRLIIVIPQKDKILAKYMEIIFNKIGFKGNGAGVPQLTVPQISSIKIPLPPLNIQEEIVKACQKVDDEVEKANEIIEEMKRKIEEEISAVGGDMVKLGDITSKIGSGATPRGGEMAYKESGITLIRSQNIYDNAFHEKGLAFIDEEQAKKLDNVSVEKNDVLFNITGASVARCFIIEEKYLPARVNQHVSIIRVTNKTIPQYLHKILTSESIKKELLTMSKASSTREAITKIELENFKIPLPPLKTQKEIVSKIEKLETQIALAKEIVEGDSFRKEGILNGFL
ncbi:MAG: restriction endonuclease subunit S [Sulfurovum sp.]